MNEDNKSTRADAAENSNEKGLRGVLLTLAGATAVGAIALLSAAATVFLQSERQTNIPPETVKKLSSQIIDPQVSAAALEKQGFYKENYGGSFIGECREFVLTGEFNKGLSTEAKAREISNCIRTRIVVYSAPAIGHYR